jgi:ferritin-like metal-binding protein YciE
MCEENLQQERAMAGWLQQQIPQATLDFLRA